MAKKKKRTRSVADTAARVAGTATGVIAGVAELVSDRLGGARKSGGTASPFQHWTTKSYGIAKSSEGKKNPKGKKKSY